MGATKLVLESCVATLGHRALVVADGLRGVELNLLATARIVVDQRNVAQAFAVLAQLYAAIGGIHHIVQIGHALRADQRQRNGGKATPARVFMVVEALNICPTVVKVVNYYLL